MRLFFAVFFAVSTLAWSPVFAQTEAECLQSFNVNQGKPVSYIVDGQFQPSVAMTCGDAELFRQRLYVSMNKGIYDSEIVLRSKLSDAAQALDKLQNDLNASIDSVAMKAKIAGATAVVYTPAAVASTVACVSAVIDGAGLAACGPAVKSSLSATTAWVALASLSNDATTIRSKAQIEIAKAKVNISNVSAQLNATTSKNVSMNYSNLFVAICRAVKKQCL